MQFLEEKKFGNDNSELFITLYIALKRTNASEKNNK